MIVHDYRPAPVIIREPAPAPVIIHEPSYVSTSFERAVLYPTPYGAPRYGVNGHLRDERRRIGRGRDQGLLTRREARRLRARLRAILREADIAHEDGYLSPFERRHLEDEEATLNELIGWESFDSDGW